MKEIIEFTITTNDPEVYLPQVIGEIAYGYRAGTADSENNWESKVIGYSDEDEEEVQPDYCSRGYIKVDALRELLAAIDEAMEDD